MKNHRTIYLLAVVLVINLVLAVIFRDFIREYVLIPILYLFWYIRLFLNSLGETCLWPLLVVILALVSLKIMGAKKKDRQRLREFGEESSQLEEGRVAFWMKYIRRKSMGIENLSLVSFRLRELVFAVMAYQENLTRLELEVELDKGKFVLPEEVQILLRPKDRVVQNPIEPSPLFIQIMDWIKVRSNSGSYRSVSEMSKVVQYLEDQLEIEHGDGNH